MAKKENSDELIVVDAKRYHRVKKALEASKAGEPAAGLKSPDEQEHTRELVVVDVKRYKKVKKDLEASEKRYRQLFENVPIGIYRTTPDGRIVDSNPALVAMLGYDSFADLSTHNLEQDYGHASYSRQEFIARLRHDGEIRGLEAVWKRKDGSLIHMRENAKLVVGEGGETFFEGTVEDITQAKLAEEAQQLHTRQLETLHALIGSGNLAGSMPELLDAILEIVIRYLDFDMAQIFFCDEAAGRVTLEAGKGVPPGFCLEEKYLALEDRPFSRVIRMGEPAFVDHVRKNVPELAQKWGWRAAGSIPLVSKGRIVGALNMASNRRDVFTHEEKETLLLVGKEAGTLISKLRTETALRESEKYYRTLVETSPDFVFVLGLDGVMTMVNPRFLLHSGFGNDEIVGRNVLELIGEMDPGFFRDGMRSLVQKNGIFQFEHPVRRKDGSTFPMEMALSVLTDPGGAPSGVMGVGRDISERKLFEAARRARTQQMEILNAIISRGNLAESVQEMLEVILKCVTEPLAFDNSGIFMLDGKTGSVRELARRGPMTGFAQSREYMSFDNRPFSEVLKHGRSLFLDDAPRAHPPFFEKWGWRMAGSVPLLSKGRVVGALSVASCRRDAFSAEEKSILEMIGKEAGTLVSKLQTEAALRESEKYYRTLIDTSPDIIVVMDLEPRLITVNQQFLKTGGYFYDEVIGACTYDFVAGLDRDLLARRTAKFIEKRMVSGSEYSFRKKDGQTLPLDVSAGFLLDDAGKPYGIIAIGRDISERKEAQDKLLAYQEQLRVLSSELTLVEERERRRIAAELHDQIGQNLALCKLKVTALEKSAAGGSRRNELAAVRRLLEVSIQDARSLIFDLSPPILYELGLQAALEWLAERIGEQYGVAVDFEDRAPGATLETDRQVLLFQVVRELLVNVGKHSRAKRAKVLLTREGGALRIQVNDDGVGFDPARIIDPQDAKTSFGFFSMRERLTYLGGTLEARSKAGRGTQIILSVPQAAPPAGGSREDS